MVESAAAKVENDNRDKLETALGKARRMLQFGDRVSAVKILEEVQAFANFQSDLGCDVLLELAMALETVSRADDARKLYGQLITQSTNSKVRRSALQLVQGLDLVSRLRKDIASEAPIVDYASLQSISMQLREGLKNEWDDYKKKGVFICSTYSIYCTKRDWVM
jgi:hypothetical protein